MNDFLKNLLALLAILAVTLVITLIYIGFFRLNVSGDGFIYWWALITGIFFLIFGYRS